MTTDILKSFGKSLRAYRVNRGLSQEELAELAHLDRTYISGVERGTRNISLKAIYSLATALEMSVSQLLAEI
ncbi:helix-turn-helix transcriptional regulator [Pseudoalteromonas sp. XMcav11-Q]|uniref:helix-turn-helix domain-containing protein n=1 Tax=Pseudoalteromonas sp. XMcav11-Q TaxID=3136665 RepID=UPI0032C3DEA5